MNEKSPDVKYQQFVFVDTGPTFIYNKQDADYHCTLTIMKFNNGFTGQLDYLDAEENKYTYHNDRIKSAPEMVAKDLVRSFNHLRNLHEDDGDLLLDNDKEG